MKPSHIFSVMDLAFTARDQGNVFNPCLVSPPGLGKSEIIQSYCKDRGLGFIDIRAALQEAPDLKGFPDKGVKEGRQVMTFLTPEFWPVSGRGVIFLDEVNRGTQAIMNCFMQLLTDRKVDKYQLPEGWVVAAAVNPENEENDVNTMDSAFRDRLSFFEVDYDKKDFVAFMKKKDWDLSIINFVESNTWMYAKPEEISKSDGAMYISPRSLSKLNTAIKAGIPDTLEKTVYDSLLGMNVGTTFYTFRHDERPVSFADLSNPKTKKAALKKLEMFSDPSNYRSGAISITIKDIVDVNEISDDLLAEVCLALPVDQIRQLLRELDFVQGKDGSLIVKMTKNYPKLKKLLKDVVNNE